MYLSNYDKAPSIPIKGEIWKGWESICGRLGNEIEKFPGNRCVIAVECYQGVDSEDILKGFSHLKPGLYINSAGTFLPGDRIKEITFPDVTDDDVFGYMTRLTFDDLLDWQKVESAREEIRNAAGLILVYGQASSMIADHADMLIYADMPRRELQLRQRRHEVNNTGLTNKEEQPSIQYKRGFFVDWRICDRLKKTLFGKIDYWLDTVTNSPRMITGDTMMAGLESLVHRPFRLVPFFDPGPWGGQWMKQVFDLDKGVRNYAWCFDCVPEENSLLFSIGGEIFEFPAINLVFLKSGELLGEPVESRFGQEFPIRFDFLDTMAGGNLSLQVHPSVQYIRERFGMNYTQDESYYLLEAKEDAVVYLGLKKGINPGSMIGDLKDAQDGKTSFDVGSYVNHFRGKKHDHFLIPGGTVHCSGAGCMVLEISATPFIFTFKLWDWDRMGLDGKPRPINIEHGANVIQWERDTDYCLDELVNQVRVIAEGDGWLEEQTGLHKNEFIETRRHWFTGRVLHDTNESVNVLNLVEGSEAIVESPVDKFEPFVVHYAETFIIPAAVGAYTIRPYGEGQNQRCATIKAYVRFKQ